MLKRIKCWLFGHDWDVDPDSWIKLPYGKIGHRWIYKFKCNQCGMIKRHTSQPYPNLRGIENEHAEVE